MSDKPTIIIRRRRRRHGQAHHGGAWKVAYADFVTALMAFFLVMWLVGALTNKQRQVLSQYFSNPRLQPGVSNAASPGALGPGGASTSMIKLGGQFDRPREDSDGLKGRSTASGGGRDRQRLEALMKDLQRAIGRSQAMEPFKDQLLLDLTPEGLRIQIVDRLNRPMFDLGSAHLKHYTADILRELAGFINRVPNRISLTGHTDVTAYHPDQNYSNWELSTDRANTARRELLAGGMAEAKVARVVGLASSVLFDRADPFNPINRRISIVVMSRDAESAALAESRRSAALGPPLPDADTQLPDLSAGALKAANAVASP